jgi:predicted transcriptional regulator of viral defense system
MYNIREIYPMTAANSGVVKARQKFAAHGGMLRSSNAIRLGIHPRTLYAMRDAAEIEQIGRGLYRLLTAPPLSNPDLVPVAVRSRRAVVCLISALAHHGLTTQVPHAVNIALPSHAQVPKIVEVPLREKTIADCFKYRNKIGLDLAIEALRTYRDRERKADFQAILRFAQINRVQKVVRPYLEAVI